MGQLLHLKHAHGERLFSAGVRSWDHQRLPSHGNQSITLGYSASQPGDVIRVLGRFVLCGSRLSDAPPPLTLAARGVEKCDVAIDHFRIRVMRLHSLSSCCAQLGAISRVVYQT